MNLQRSQKNIQSSDLKYHDQLLKWQKAKVKRSQRTLSSSCMETSSKIDPWTVQIRNTNGEISIISERLWLWLLILLCDEDYGEDRTVYQKRHARRLSAPLRQETCSGIARPSYQEHEVMTLCGIAKAPAWL